MSKFLANVPIFMPLENTKKQRFSGVFRGYEMGKLTRNDIFRSAAMRGKCPYSELFWSVFSHIRAEYGKIRSTGAHLGEGSRRSGPLPFFHTNKIVPPILASESLY